MPAREVPDKFLVAFSLAGEQRELVEAVATEVERRLGTSTVFYDEWYEYYIAGNDADLKLQEIYLSKCELAVACISGQYGGKPWTTAEHTAIRARYMQATGSQADRDRVLLVRVGDGEVDGILLNAIVPDVRPPKSIDDAATLIIDRLGLVRPTAEQSVGQTDWPDQAPELRWPMADHTDARAAFAQLLTQSSEARVLFITGPSETGKSHMSKQILSNAVRMAHVRCGRFDFKGTTNMDLEVEKFVQFLDLTKPAAPSLSAQFAQLLEELRRSPQPTVLIFDTYEQAGEAKDWVESVLLRELIRSPWLRVVILGQPVGMPARGGAVWESVARNPVQLRPPGPEDWLAYGLENRPDEAVDIEFVTRIHQGADGKPSILAGLLGPR